MTGIYIHIPFCLRRCNYCDFCSSVADFSLIEAYADAVVRNLDASDCKGIKVDTVYFGGGTPSLFEPPQMSEIMSAVRRNFDLSPNSEITTEANPGTVDEKKLVGYRSAGINRISFGMQSCKDNELHRLGRLHRFSDVKKAVRDAISAGFENISCDLMLGIPEQTFGSLRESVAAVCDLGVQHVSAYMLRIEEDTPFDCDEIRNAVPDDDAVAQMYLQTVEQLSLRGFAQYEISNFAVSGFESRHNLKYWRLEPYLGFGASAHSFFGGKRFFIPPDIPGFIFSDVQTVLVEDASPNLLEEYVMLGLRLCEGISLDRVKELGGDPQKLLRAVQPMVEHGLAVADGGRIRLTPEGFLVSNGIISRMIDELL